MSFRISPVGKHNEVKSFMEDVKNKVLKVCNKQLQTYPSLKTNFELFGMYLLEEKVEIKSFQTKYAITTLGTNLEEYVEQVVEILSRKESEFQGRDSGWVLVDLLYLECNFLQFNPIKASSYIDLPPSLKRRKAIINVDNNDQMCFGWTLASALIHPTGKPQRKESYPDILKIFNWDGIQFPVPLSSIPTFEANNPKISVNVYGIECVYKDGKQEIQVIGPLYYSKSKKINHVNMLLISNKAGNTHYTYINNFSRLVSKQISQRNGATHFCDGCINYFRTEQQLKKHQMQDCNHTSTILPTTTLKLDKTGNMRPENLLTFTNFQKQMLLPFVIYADFESILQPLDTAEPDPKKSFTIKTCKHTPYSFCYYIKSSYNDEWSRLETYRGENAAQIFITRLQNDIKNIYREYLLNVRPMEPLSEDELRMYDESRTCFICQNPFDNDSTNPKVKDHCHITGKYRGSAHATCNLNYKIPNFIPVVFHNLSGYDSHLFVKELGADTEDIDVIPTSTEKYITFSKRVLVDEVDLESGKKERKYMKLRFIDSFRFMPTSLDKLSTNLTSEQCAEIRKFFNDSNKFQLLRKKGCFPYSYVDCMSKLDEKDIPSHTKFYNDMTQEHISRDEYERVVRIWNVFNCKTLGDYSDLYLKTDVLLLADVFQNFRSLCMNVYGVDAAHYVTTPGLTWDAMLKFTRVKLELLTDMDMYHMIKKGIRGGVSTCIKRKSCANNEFVPGYDSNQAKVFIQYLDATNLYGNSMREYLPVDGFSWLTRADIEKFNVHDISDESDVGYILEVDLHYPLELHSTHNDLPFCPENILPPRAKYKQTKLIPNLYDKSKYVIHYRNLKQCLKHGLVLTHVHRILKFNQKPWLRDYIDLNTRMRNKATNSFEKDFFKLMNNGVFGKTMENVDKRKILKLLTHWENYGRRRGLESFITQPHFKKFTQFSHTLFAVEMSKVSVVYNKPIYVGFTILDVSKIVMYRFFYDILRAHYGKNVSLLYTDTDSFILEVKTHDLYEHMRNNLNEYDTSNYKNNLHGVITTPSIVGKMKDEYAGKAIHLFYGAGAKSYCVKTEDDVIKKAKGVKKITIKKDLSEFDYKCVAEQTDKKVFCKMLVFKSTLHDIYTELVNKIGLSSYDDKRFVIPNTCDTLAWGHRDIRRYENYIDLDNILQNPNVLYDDDSMDISDELLDGLIKAFESTS
ncbi:hypothetical protein PPYR_11269 [Photinus pyralis]|uniref:DNA-directed DNA polymerase n=3 Tax=Photinus pyralis TaxID=7054 RepID=A0A5N4A5L4_PHOPY|nr:uncharacterized protein LOC116176003 [Photinus pyralis]XP_031356268.1 uncharacterized protein LOC116180431 [Photinus pyralis]KAB0792615.1 hypothetical protein PPYR_14574 [Photinus pyralis]KAB0794430.1 hypothetical protein PPYR_11269 [Photinus pyralis]